MEELKTEVLGPDAKKGEVQEIKFLNRIITWSDVGIVLASCWHHFEIICVFVFDSLENVIFDTPTMKINGFDIWNVLQNVVKLNTKPCLETAPKQNTKMMQKCFRNEVRNAFKIYPEAIFVGIQNLVQIRKGRSRGGVELTTPPPHLF